VETSLLRAFIATADAGALSRAARRLGISQPSLTVQIQRLEQYLGASLFDRHGRGVALTDVGKALYPRARRIMDEVRATEESLRRDVAEGFGTLVVGAIPTVAPYVLPGAIERLRARHPNMRIELREEYSAVLAELLHDGALDVAIAALPFVFENLEIESLGTDDLLVAVPVEHPAARAGHITMDEIRGAPTVTLDRAHCLGEQVSGFCTSRHVSPAVVCRSAQLSTVFEMVGVGVGISIVPAMAAARHNTARHACVPLADVPLQREIVAVWRKDRSKPALARAFVDCVREVVKGR
jgi:LysR family hydrogen peroxide-inducible transcriptional activator